MSAQIPRVVVNTRQRLLSEDFNNVSALTSKALIMLELAREVGDDYLQAAAGRSGVVGGFLVRCLPATNTIEISPGIALMADAAIDPTYDPPEVWIQQNSTVSIDLSALIDPVNPRLVTIEVAPSDGTLVSSAIDVFDPGTGLFGVNPLAPRVQGSVPIWFTTAGAPAAAPVLAGGTVGRIPIAVVKLVGAQAGFADEFASVLMCRPLLGADADRLVPRGYVEGGGCSVGEESGGVLVGLTGIYLSHLTASLAGVEGSLAGLIKFTSLGRTSNLTNPATLLAVAGPVYGYAAPPPWPGDYGSMAAREAWQRNPNAVASVSIGNVIGGQGSTFTSLSAETTSAPGRSLRSAIVLWDDVAPYGLERGAGNAPLQVVDARGPHPNTAPGGSGSITLEATQDPTWGPSQSVTETVYVGAVSALNLALDFMAQRFEGSGQVRVIDLANAFGVHRRPFGSFAVNAAAAAFYPTRFPAMLVGDAQVLPLTTDSISVYGYFVSGVAGVVGFAVGSAIGFGQGEPAASIVPYLGNKTIQLNGALSGPVTIGEEFNRLTIDASLAGRYWLTALAGTSLAFALTGYVDLILAAR